MGLAILAFLGACGGGPSTPMDTTPDALEFATIPPVGTEATLELGTWNLEWFGDPSSGPEDEEVQTAAIAHLLAGAEVDLWSVQEVVSEERFDSLMDRLPGYEGILADDPRVQDGPAFYEDFDGREMKVGLVYRSAEFRIDGARVVLTEFDHAFAGRPPLELRLVRTTAAGESSLVVLLLHAKAGAEAEDRSRREAGARALKSYLDEVWPSTAVAVLGDFNDDVDTSIQIGAPSPYLAFVSDSADYRFPTRALSLVGASSTVFYDDVVDHHLVTDELYADYEAGSAEVLQADRWIPNYGESTSDHFPVVTRYDPRN